MLLLRNLCTSFVGSRPRSSAVLVQLQELVQCEEQLDTKQAELEQLKSELKQVHQVARK